jgi:hypothetical protein
MVIIIAIFILSISKKDYHERGKRINGWNAGRRGS